MAFIPPGSAQPIGRGWGKLGALAMILVVGIASPIAFSAFNQSGGGDDESKKDPSFNVYTPPDIPRVNVTAGYAKPPPPPAPIVQPAPNPPPEVRHPAPVAQSAYVSPPAPPKPMASGFVGQMSPQIAGDQISPRGMGGSSPTDEYRPGMSENKNEAWLATAGTGGRDFVTEPFMPPISRNMIQSGITIRARLLNAVDSDLPGDVVAQITSHVCDTPTGKVELIPAGSKLYGRYNPTLVYGQTRAQVSWNRILFVSDGSSQNIGSMNGVDDIGRAGVGGNVNHHPWSLAGAVALSTFSTLIGQAGTLVQGNGDTTIGVVGADAAARPTADIGNQLAQKEISRPNTIEICMTPDDQTCNVAVLVSKDISLPPRGACN